MAMRRIARQGRLLAAEQQHQPVASTSQALALPPRRSLSHAVPLSPTPEANASSAGENKSAASNANTSWAALSRASQAFFAGAPPRSSSDPSSSPGAAAAELSGPAGELVRELKQSRPDPHRAWELFSQCDLQGQTPSLPLISLHALLPAIQLKPEHRTLSAVIADARTYQAKVDLIRLRLRQSGASPTYGDFNALVWQYHALRYAPGASRTWDEALEAGCFPTAAVCGRILETFCGWVELHGRASGRAVERAAAQPLAKKAAHMLFREIGLDDRKRVDACIEPFFKLAIKAGDLHLFGRAMKALYGFDIKLPGAKVDVSSHARRQLRTIGEREVCWILEALAERDNLPAMVATFETFDQPVRPADESNSASFFSSFSPSASAEADSTPAAPATSEAAAHLVGTRAFAILVQTAARLGNGALARHYFDLLFMRWSQDADKRIGEIEEAVGVQRSQESETATDQQDTAAAVESEVDERFRSLSIVSRFGSHLTASPSAPAKPYAVPSTLIASVALSIKAHYDARSARWLRRRTRHILQRMEEQMQRISAVLSALEPAADVDASSDAPPPDSPSASRAPPLSVVALQHELVLVSYHLDQLRLTLTSVKADARIVDAWKRLHLLQTTLSRRVRRLASPSLPKNVAARLRPGVQRKERQVLLGRMLVVRNRINKLREIEGGKAGNWELDRWVAEYKLLKAQAETAGFEFTAPAEGEGSEETKPAAEVHQQEAQVVVAATA
ncbi:uncharacterized protein JCM10292_003052 [Rhodotorula paludigena]|uniref:uncharacterized protein n=1 Tax=Rhodotorula paludigena TaxID=86838 RepID=UPI003176E322